MKLRPLERTIETALLVGVALSGALLVGGLALGSTSALRWGIILLMLTPVARVLVVTLGLLFEGDITFGLVSFFVLGVLASGIAVAVVESARSAPPPP